MKQKYKGDSAKNARIRIDYRGTKPKVKFSFPHIKNPTEGSMFPYIFMTWAFVVWFGFLAFVFLDETFNNIETFWIKLMVGLGIIICVPCLIYFPFRKYWVNVFPRFQEFMATLRGESLFITFNKNSFENFGVKNYLEIPLFENIFLHYEATKEFSKYLDYFEVKEYPIKIIKGKSKKQSSDEYWYARFYFKQIPETGTLEVEFH